ncbi:MAG: hypothetical protein MUC86_09930 [Burkholderiaceae bacterium]|nr:hypothetical protein [Burkholderiaceae bacterium]
MSDPRSRRAGRRRLLAAALLLAGAHLHAQPAPSSSSAHVLSPLALVGRWQAADDHPTLGRVTTRLTIAQTLRFSGEAARGGEVFWRFAGTLELAGRSLTWRYEDSSLPLNDAARTDIDDVLAADTERLVLRSRLSGKERVFTRVR